MSTLSPPCHQQQGTPRGSSPPQGKDRAGPQIYPGVTSPRPRHDGDTDPGSSGDRSQPAGSQAAGQSRSPRRAWDRGDTSDGAPHRMHPTGTGGPHLPPARRGPLPQRGTHGGCAAERKGVPGGDTGPPATNPHREGGGQAPLCWGPPAATGVSRASSKHPPPQPRHSLD